jgi:hypothetical protein
MIKYELQNIISGKSQTSTSHLIQTITNYLGTSKSTSRKVEERQHTKEQETEKLLAFIDANNLWYIYEINENFKIGEGAEQKVYLDTVGEQVIKLNDGIFYLLWLDYFHSLLLHNYFFPDTCYNLLGFKHQDNQLYAVVGQSFIRSTTFTNLDYVKVFLILNGFENKKNNDYFNKELGIILEDLHDENVIVNNGVLFFIDTVFYLTDDFWK